MHRFPGPSRALSSRDELLGRVLRLLAPDRARLILVRTNEGAASAALVAAVLDRHGGRAQVVLYPSDPFPAAYRPPANTARSWAVLPAATVPGSMDQTARSMRVIPATLLEDPDQPLTRCLWLPPSFLEGYARVPSSPDGILVVDDWHSLVAAYQDVDGANTSETRDASDLDPLLVDAFRGFSRAHLIVVTKRSSQVLSDAADAILDVTRRVREDGIVEVHLARDTLEIPPPSPYVLRLDPGGLLA